MRTLQLTLPLLLGFGSLAVFADQIAFKNGDRLTGSIVKSDAKNLVIRTAVAGEVTVQWQEIQELHSDQRLHVRLANGQSLVGKLTTSDGRLEIDTETGDRLQSPSESLVALRNDTEQLAYENALHPGPLRAWEGGLDLGVALTRGNSKTKDFRLAFRAVRKVSRDKLTLYAESIYSTDDVPAALPHVTANQTNGGARFDRDLTPRLFAFANADFMSDALQDLNLRSVLGGGIGYHLLKSERATLDLLGGANFTRENYVEIQRNLAAGEFGEELMIKLTKNTFLTQDVAFFPDLIGPGFDYRVNFSMGTVTKIVNWLGWQNNVIDNYVTNPPAGKKQNEFVFTSGLFLGNRRIGK